MNRVRVGFVGTGSMGQVAHLQNYLRLGDDVEIVALAEPRQELAQAVAARAGVGRVYESAEQMLAHEKLDALVAPQPFTHHLQVVAPLYDAGLPIITEKPLAMSSAVGAEMLLRLDASATPFHMVAYHKRSDPAVERAKELVSRLRASGECGELRYVRMTMAGTGWALGAFDDMLTTNEPIRVTPADVPADDPYVSFVNFYIHQVNLVRHLLGESYSVKYGDRAGRLLIGESLSGAPVSLEMEPWGEPGWDESITVGFDQGQVRVTLPPPLASRQAGVLEVRGDLGQGYQSARPMLPPTHAMLQQAKNFVRAVRGEIAPPSDAHDAYLDLVVADEYFAVRNS